MASQNKDKDVKDKMTQQTDPPNDDTLSNAIFNDNCSSLQECDSLKRIGIILNVYQNQINGKNNKLNIINPSLLIDDYIHLLSKHIDKSFNEIYKHLIGIIGDKCDINSCKKYLRNSKKQIDDNKDDNNYNDNDNVSILDTIHCNLIHSYDIGTRLNIQNINNINNNNDDNDNDNSDDADDDNKINEFKEDAIMNDIMKTIKLKQKTFCDIRGSDQISNNKFVTTFPKNTSNSNDNNNNTTTDDNKIDTSLFEIIRKIAPVSGKYLDVPVSGKYFVGFRFYYWNWYKNNDNVDKLQEPEQYRYSSLYVSPKFASFKEEIINILQNINLYNDITKNVDMYFQTQYIKRIKCGVDWMMHYDIKQGTALTKEHILAAQLYSNINNIRDLFINSFRPLNPAETMISVKNRNAKYHYWSKRLRELVESYGTDAYNSRTKSFWHGSSYVYFTQFVPNIFATLSTSSSIIVPMLFNQETNGIIIELNRDCAYSFYFDISYLSCFGYEQEILWFGGYKVLQFASLRLLNNNKWLNYDDFTKILARFNFIIKGEYSTMHNSPVTSNDFYMLSSLVSPSLSSGSTATTLPKVKDKYIIGTWNAFASGIKTMKISTGEWQFPFSSPFYCVLFFLNTYGIGSSKMLNYMNIIKIFKNIKTITLTGGYDKEIDISGAYLSSLFRTCMALSPIQNQITTISIDKVSVKYTTTEFTEKKMMFKQNGWILTQQKQKDDDICLLICKM